MPSILIIDDEQGIRSVLKDVLEDEGYSVLLAEDGLRGLSLLETNQVDLVILGEGYTGAEREKTGGRGGVPGRKESGHHPG